MPFGVIFNSYKTCPILGWCLEGSTYKLADWPSLSQNCINLVFFFQNEFLKTKTMFWNIFFKKILEATQLDLI